MKEIKKIFNDVGLTLLDEEEKGIDYKHKCCDKDGYLYRRSAHTCQYILKNNKFEKQLLTIDEIQELYPNYSIIRVSDFKNNEIKIYKKFMSKKKILLLNDTENSFYKYNYKPASVNPERIKPFIRLSRTGKIVFSHYGEDSKESPALKIFVINEF